VFVFLVYGVYEIIVLCVLEDVSTSSLLTVIYMFVSFEVFDSMSLGFSQTIGKLIEADG
jgi:hypothetical protein